MAWNTILQKDQLSIVIDDEHNRVLFETSSGGYRPRYVTLHLNHDELDELISSLQQAKDELKLRGTSE
jgi:hypothetical protein